MYAQGGKGISEPGAQGFFLLALRGFVGGSLGVGAADAEADAWSSGAMIAAVPAVALGAAVALGVAAARSSKGAAGPEAARCREHANAAPLTTTARNSLLPRLRTPRR
ncbi:MAG TPA: hypothetical protein VGL19_05735 [Polyangiaceae bacterium]|jgi:hypothetical protein